MRVQAQYFTRRRGSGRFSRAAVLLGVCVALALVTLVVRPAHAAEQLVVEAGKSIVLKYLEKIETVSLANDDIADVVAITADELVVIGKAPGTTTLVVWGATAGYTMYEIKVVRNFSGRQILLEVQIGEVNKNAFSKLGFDALLRNSHYEDIDFDIGSYAGAVRTPSVPLSVGEGVTGLFHFVGRDNDVTAIVTALQEQGDLKMLATPKLLSLSGEKASFLAGGEIPVPISQGSSATGSQTITVEWKEYGVRLNFVPTVIDSDLISLTLEPEVSSLDFTNAVIIGGFAIPAMLTRRAKTTVELHSNEAMYLGGLVSNEQIVNRKRVPILGHIPILGALFTRKETSSRETELVIIVSPRIIGPVAAETIPALPWNGPEEELEEGVGEVEDSGKTEDVGEIEDTGETVNPGDAEDTGQPEDTGSAQELEK